MDWGICGSAGTSVCPLGAVLHRIVCGLMAQAGDLIGPIDMEEPNCPQDGDGVGVEQVEQALVLHAVWNTLPKLV